MEFMWRGDENEEEYCSDLLQTDDEDEEFEPNAEEIEDEYDSSGSEIEFVEEDDLTPDNALLSKDKQIKYTLDEPTTIRRSNAAVFTHSGKIYLQLPIFQ